mgnify:CR=1 FL=1
MPRTRRATACRPVHEPAVRFQKKIGAQQRFGNDVDSVVCQPIGQYLVPLHKGSHTVGRRSRESVFTAMLIHDLNAGPSELLDLVRCEQLAQYEEPEYVPMGLLLRGQQVCSSANEVVAVDIVQEMRRRAQVVTRLVIVVSVPIGLCRRKNGRSVQSIHVPPETLMVWPVM